MAERPWLERGVRRAVVAAASVAGGALVAHATAAVPPTVSRPSVEPAPIAAPASSPIAAVEPLDVVEPIEAAPVVLDAVRSDLSDGAVITGSTAQRIILFTFDDGPDPRYTRRLLDELDRRGVRALFFLSAERFAGPTPWAAANREIVRDIVARGHNVASHGYRHLQFTRMSSPELVLELERAEQAFVDAIGLRPVLIRPPGGARSPRTDAVLASRGYTSVLWNLGTGDAQVRTADEVVETFRRVLLVREHETGSRGGIVLLHDIHAWSLEAFPRILDHLNRRNCALLEQGEELYDVIDDPAPFFAQRGENVSADAPWASLPDDVYRARQDALRVETAERCGRLAMR